LLDYIIVFMEIPTFWNKMSCLLFNIYRGFGSSVHVSPKKTPLYLAKVAWIWRQQAHPKLR